MSYVFEGEDQWIDINEVKDEAIIQDPCEEGNCYFETDPDVWIKKKLEAETYNQLQELEKARVNTLILGQHYEVIPHIRCHQCGKVIGNLWEKFIDYTRVKRFTPEEIIEQISDGDIQKELLNALENPPDFLELLDKYELLKDFNTLYSKGKYTYGQIFKKLDLRRPCCRMNIFSPVHIPMKQDAFKEEEKVTKTNNSLLGVVSDPLNIKYSKKTISSEIKRDRVKNYTPLMSTKPPEEERAECKSKARIIPVGSYLRSTERLPEPTNEDELLNKLTLEAIDPVSKITEEEKQVFEVPVGAGYQVPSLARTYRVL
jgi:DNA-directed RNA polymerase subunit N (RpoN/RPB10)